MIWCVCLLHPFAPLVIDFITEVKYNRLKYMDLRFCAGIIIYDSTSVGAVCAAVCTATGQLGICVFGTVHPKSQAPQQCAGVGHLFLFANEQNGVTVSMVCSAPQFNF